MERPLTEHIKADGTMLNLQEYEQAGGYQGLRKALQSMTPKQVMDTVTASNLRGRGSSQGPLPLWIVLLLLNTWNAPSLNNSSLTVPP